MWGIERTNAFIREKGFDFEISAADLDLQFHSVHTPSGRKVWFKGRLVGDLITVWFGDWRNAEDKHKFSTKETGDLSRGEQRELKKLDREVEELRKAKTLVAKTQVEELMGRWSRVQEPSDYLQRKNLGYATLPAPAFVRLGEEDAQRILVVPMFDSEGELWNFQQLYRSGIKTFHPNARAKGLFHTIQGNRDVVLIGEGFATCLAAWQASGFHTLVGFSAGNLERVLQAAIKIHPAENIILLADWDGETFERVGENPGMLACTKLALKYGVRVAAPGFPGVLMQEDKNVDFADLNHDEILERLADSNTLSYQDLSAYLFKEKREKKQNCSNLSKSDQSAPLADGLSAGPSAPPAADAPVWKRAPQESVAHLVKPSPRAGFVQNYDGLQADMLPDILRSKNGGIKVLGTLRNFEVIMQFVQATLRYNVIKKDQEWFIPGEEASLDNYKNVLYGRVVDLCARVGFPEGKIDHYLTYLCEQKQFNPVAVWVESKPWDGVSRLEEFYATVHTVGEEQDADKLRMKKTFMRKWMLMALAGAYRPEGIAAPGMLVFQGVQYIGKTKWLLSLVPPELELAIDGRIVDTRDKDSVGQTVCYWLVELGELDATFKKSDIAALKAFVTRDRDTFRPAYAKKACNFVRRTVFFGSVNHESFLADTTGNRRYWTLDVDRVVWDHGLDMQQVWAELLVTFKRGGDDAQWWLNDAEMQWLNESNRKFEVVDTIEERLAGWYDWSEPEERGEWLTSTEILISIGIDRPSNGDAQKCAAAIKRLNGGRHDRRPGSGARVLWVPKARRSN